MFLPHYNATIFTPIYKEENYIYFYNNFIYFDNEMRKIYIQSFS
jgi:hypothetical protein